jgi:hypothetical protein
MSAEITQVSRRVIPAIVFDIVIDADMLQVIARIN